MYGKFGNLYSHLFWTLFSYVVCENHDIDLSHIQHNRGLEEHGATSSAHAETLLQYVSFSLKRHILFNILLCA